MYLLDGVEVVARPPHAAMLRSSLLFLLLLLNAALSSNALDFGYAPHMTRQHVLRSAFTSTLLFQTTTVDKAQAYQGVYGMDIISAKDAVLDEEALKSNEVKAALKDLRNLYSSVKSLRESVASDSQYDVSKVIRTDFDVTRVRNTFNALNPVFDKDTQKGTDRLQRGILQDLVEIDSSAKITPGKARSPKKLALVNEKLRKLEATFQQLDEYFSGAPSA